jgi:hypothetical protein
MCILKTDWRENECGVANERLDIRKEPQQCVRDTEEVENVGMFLSVRFVESDKTLSREGPKGRAPGYSQVVSGGVGKPKSSLSLQS